MNKLVLVLFILFTQNAFSSGWSNYQEIRASSIEIRFDQNIQQIVGNLSLEVWRSETKFDGKRATDTLIQNFSDDGYLIMSHVKFPPTFVIVGSGNDRKFIAKQIPWLLNIDDRDSPIRKIRKKDLIKYRDIQDIVVPYVLFGYEDNTCVVFKKGYYTQESGYHRAAEDDEYIIGLYCDYDNNLDMNQVESLIDSITLVSLR